ncbi:hypothetical protein QYE76_019586 [Lolium multiflorum]|uniref:O-methyltransferase C-terminal domain-containing protein n=1 Tax=Lolium multiflorum TaxID=4521 RepID=A0AAD8R6T0_LOLMU|nr:hypothetical protein QYE76_019586 [Lolium multiflorum]
MHALVNNNLAIDIVLKGARGIFHWLSSLINIGGGHGIATVAIVKEFPQITCNMLDLEQVTRKLPSCGMVKYILGDMFEFIPHAINSNISTTIDSTMQQLGAFLNHLI